MLSAESMRSRQFFPGMFAALALGLLLAACSADLEFGRVLVECFESCTIPNAEAVCVEGACHLLVCKRGFADCNASAEDGCEVPLLDDPVNCGACENSCVGECREGSCHVLEPIYEGLETESVFLANDRSHLYFADAAVMQRVPLDGGERETLVSADGLVRTLALDGDDLYWLERSSTETFPHTFALRHFQLGSGSVRELGSVEGAQAELVVTPSSVYVAAEVRVPEGENRASHLFGAERDGGELTALRGWEPPQLIFHLDRRGDALVAVVYDAERNDRNLVEYVRAEERVDLLHQGVRGGAFAVSGDTVYQGFGDGRDGGSLYFFAVGQATEYRLATVPHVVRAIVLRPDAIYLLDGFRGALSRFDAWTQEIRLLFGEQGPIANVVVADAFVYFSANSRIFRLPLDAP